MVTTYTPEALPTISSPEFDLPIANPWVDGADTPRRSLARYSDANAVLVVFTCNHCPYAKHVWPELERFAHDYAERGVQVVAINPNDASRYPADSFEAMADEARERGLSFPYLHDPTQQVARAYGAVCTPDLFLLAPDHRVVYRGRVDETRPGTGEPHGADLRAATDRFLADGTATTDAAPSVGCSIKWAQG